MGCFSCWDHPRVGGEKPTSSAHCQGPSGSPPRGRGKVRRGHSDDCCCGITPAWAGKRTLPDLREAANGDHPRVGGEKLTIKEKYLWQRGSPPRGRGKDLTDTRHLRGLRITPAWAGKRWLLLSQHPGCLDHPRVGGEKERGHAGRVLRLGSPPRGRGKVKSVAAQVGGIGITPAWAGKRHERQNLCCYWQDHPRVGGEKLSSKPSCCSHSGSPPRGRGKGPGLP